MLFECKIKRKNGSTVVWKDVKHVFKPKAEGGAHVCEVTDPELIERLQKNPSFVALGAPTVAEAPPKPVAALAKPSRAPEVVRIGALEVPLAEIVQSAHEKSGLTVTEWNRLSDNRIEELCFDECEARAMAQKPADSATAQAGDQTDSAGPGEPGDAPGKPDIGTPAEDTSAPAGEKGSKPGKKRK